MAQQRLCEMSSSMLITNNLPQICCFCNKGNDVKRYGEMISDSGVTAHNFCLLFSSGLAQQGDDSEGLVGFLADDVIKEQRRSQALRCVYCRKKGASVGCGYGRCKKSYHYGCGKDHNVMYLYSNEFRSYCNAHRLHQTDLTRAQRVELETKPTDTCYICYENVETKISATTILAPCCTRAWYHRTCVDDMAYSAGIHFFKCPLCNNFEEWQSAMLEAGLYIPDRDASWELVPNAYNSLLETNIECEGEPCLCPQGRKEDREDSEWELILCETCGSQACHISCGRIRPQDKEWLCKVCRDAPGNAPISVVTTRSTAVVDASEETSSSPTASTPTASTPTASTPAASCSTSSHSTASRTAGTGVYGNINRRSTGNHSTRRHRASSGSHSSSSTLSNTRPDKKVRARKYVKKARKNDLRRRINRVKDMHDVTNLLRFDG